MRVHTGNAYKGMKVYFLEEVSPGILVVGQGLVGDPYMEAGMPDVPFGVWYMIDGKPKGFFYMEEPQDKDYYFLRDNLREVADEALRRASILMETARHPIGAGVTKAMLKDLH